MKRTEKNTLSKISSSNKADNTSVDVRLVSVCMITYNQEKYVAEALEGVFSQRTRHRLEIIIGDDASVDGTVEIIKEYDRLFPGVIRVIQRAVNIGMMGNFIDVFERCSGDYICLLEGDDRWTSPHKIERQVSFMESHPNCAVCFHDTRVLHEAGEKADYRSPGPRFPRMRTISNLAKGNFIQTPSVMYRGGLNRTLPKWFPSAGIGDWPLHLLHAAHGYVAYLPVVMADYRVHAAGAWSIRTPAYRLERWMRTCRHLRAHFWPRFTSEFGIHIAFCHARMVGSMPLKEWRRQGVAIGIGRLRNDSPRTFFVYQRQGLAELFRKYAVLKNLYARAIMFIRGSRLD